MYNFLVNKILQVVHYDSKAYTTFATVYVEVYIFSQYLPGLKSDFHQYKVC